MNFRDQTLLINFIQTDMAAFEVFKLALYSESLTDF